MSRLVVPEAEEVLGKYFPVLDHGFVALVDYMGGDLAIEQAARCSYNIGDEVRTINDTRNLIRYLTRHRHSSPLEMVELKFHIGLPIFVMRQLVRHRTASLNEYSGRYSVMPMMFYTPSADRLAKQSATNGQGSGEGIPDGLHAPYYDELYESRLVDTSHYKWLLQEDFAKELARIDLPLSMYTYCYVKMDLRNLFHFIGLRSESHAQEEIQVFSDVMAGIAQRVAPLAFEAFLDYQFDGVSLSRLELQVVRLAFMDGESLDDKWMSATGMSKREIAEFRAKLEPRVFKDFTLSVDSAKPASYFFDMVKGHSR